MTRPRATAGDAYAWAILAAVMSVGVVPRLVALDHSLWLDELHTSWVIGEGFDPISARARMGNTSPLFFYLEFGIIRVFGHSEWSLRLLSCAAGILLMPVSYLIVRRWTASRVAGLTAAALMAIDSNFLFYATEARTYALVQLGAILTTWLCYRNCSVPFWWSRSAYIAVTWALFYLHYSTLLLLGAHFVYWGALGLWRRQLPYSPIALGFDLTVITLGCLPSLEHVAQIAARRELWRFFVDDVTFTGFWQIYPIRWHLALPMAVVLALAVWNRYRGKTFALHVNNPSTLLLCLCWLLVPLSVAAMLTNLWDIRLFFPRYLIAASSATVWIAAMLVALPRSNVQRVMVAITTWIACLAFASPLGTTNVTVAAIRHNQNWREAIALVEQEIGSTGLMEPIFIHSGLIESVELETQNVDAAMQSQLRSYCLLPVSGLYRLNAPASSLVPVTNRGQAVLTSAQQRQISTAKRAWLITNGNKKVRDQIVAVLNRQQGHDRSPWRFLGGRGHDFGGVQVLRLTIQPVIDAGPDP